MCCNVNIRRCVEPSNYEISMIIVEKRMTYEVIVNHVPESYLGKMCPFVIIATCMHVSVGKVGVAGRFDPLSRDLPMP